MLAKSFKDNLSIKCIKTSFQTDIYFVFKELTKKKKKWIKKKLFKAAKHADIPADL